MYTLENQVCTLKQARKFDELGLKLESYFIWMEIDKECKEWILTTNLTYVKSDDFCEYPAYSSAELDVLLPSRCTIDEILLFYHFRKNGDNDSRKIHPVSYTAGYFPYPVSNEVPGIGYTEAKPTHIKSSLLLHLLKEKIVKPQDLSF